MSTFNLEKVAGILESHQGIVYPGASLVVGVKTGSGEFSRLSYTVGNHSYDPSSYRINSKSLFDVASLTKGMITAQTILAMVRAGKISLDDKVGQFFSVDECGSFLRDVTIQELLSHQVVFDLPKEQFEGLRGQDSIDAVLNAPRIQGARYGNLTFVVLGEILRKVWQAPSLAVREFLTEPLGLTDTLWHHHVPASQRHLMVPTGPENHGVHDPLTRRIEWVEEGSPSPILCCVSGVRSTAEDIATIAEAILSGGKNADGMQVLPPNVAEMLLRNIVPEYVPRAVLPGEKFDSSSFRYSYGVDLITGTSDPFPTFGVGGFTGCGVWVCPQIGLYMVLLSNAVYPKQGAKSPVTIRDVRKKIWGELLPR